MSAESKLQEVLDTKEAVKNTAAYQRLAKLFDKDSMLEFDSMVKSEDALAEVVTAYGTIDGMAAYAFAQNGDVAGGAVSKAQAAKISKLYDFAGKVGAPVIGIFDSQGARLKQGGEILAAYGDVLLASSGLSGVVPQISVIAGTCVGTNAIIASGADIVIAVKGTDFGVETDGSDKKSEDANESVHILTEDVDEALEKTRQLVTMLPSNNLGSAVNDGYSMPTVSGDALASASEAINAIVDGGSLVELQENFGKAAFTALASVDGDTVGVVATESGCGALDSDGSVKAARFVRFCDAFSIPIITLVDACGFASVRDASKLAHAYADATTVKVAVITGAAYGAAFVAMAGRSANADFTVAWPNAVISPLAPETFAAVMYEDKLKGVSDPAAKRAEIVDEYKSAAASAASAAYNGYIDDVIAPADTRAVVSQALDMLRCKRVTGQPRKHSNIQL